MPIRFSDPFIDPLADLNLAVNRYAQLLRDGGEDPAMPLSYGPALKNRAGQWRAKLGHSMGQIPEALWVEIGCHNGGTAMELASARPSWGILGLDITFKRVVKTASKAVQGGHRNVHSLLCNAAGLGQVFAPGEIDGLVLFFPDPWVRKKSQRKNRLLNEVFAQEAFRLLAPGGMFWFKTDQLDYFQEGRAALAAAGFAPIGPKAQAGLPALSPTTFERHFLAKGIASFGGCWQKPPGSAFIVP